MKQLLSWLIGAALALPTVVHAAPDPAPAEPDPAASLPPSSSSGVRRFALVIGSNHTLDDSLAALRFADDDAARMTEVLVEAGVDVELVTTLDHDSQALFGPWVARSHRPSRAGLDAAWSALKQRMAAARTDGASAVELLVYYSGHGDVGPDGQGYLTLDGSKLKRRDLFRHVLGESTADRNHVLIDACKSEQFVLARGKDGSGKDAAGKERAWTSDRSAQDYGEAVGEYLDKNHLGHFPNTGVVLAHSADQQTHEWERYRGGVFTHELLSGLRGAADLNGDGAIEYSELGAFVSAANHGVSDPRARLSVVVRPPQLDERQPLLVHDDVAEQRVLYFPSGDRFRYSVEDARGVRVADVRRSGEQPGYLRLPAGDLFVMRMTPSVTDDGQEAALPASEGGIVVSTALSYGPAQSAPRGALDQAFREGLFATPFGPGYYSGFTARTGLLAVADPEWHVEVWKVVDGQREKVADVATTTAPQIEVAQAPPAAPPKPDESDNDRDNRISWGGVQFGTIVSPFRGDESVPLSPKRVTSDKFRGCLDPHGGTGCSALRGFDLRWQYFWVDRDARFPRYVLWFRSGYQGGRASFSPAGGDSEFATGNPTALSYLVVPLYFGGQIYLFDKFPLRPFAGTGVGFDIVQARYLRQDTKALTRSGGLFGFELHAGLELRITNYVALTAEVRQQWTTRKRVDDLPDFANTGLSFVTGITAGFPLTLAAARAHRARRR